MHSPEKLRARELVRSLLMDQYAEGKEYRLDLRTLFTRIDGEGISFLTKQLPRLGKSLYRSLANATLEWDRGLFKESTRARVPELFRSCWLQVFDSDGRLLDNPNPKTIRFLSTICFLFYKLEMEVQYDEQELVSGFVNNDDQVIDDLNDPYLEQMIRFDFQELFDDFSFEKLEPSHGPGVSSNVKKHEKFFSVPYSSPCIETFGAEFFSHTASRRAVYWLRSVTALCYTILGIEPEIVPYKPTARMIFVPKDSRGPRIISCEPWEHMYAQQSIKRYMTDKLESHPLTRGLVNFTSQDVNKSLVMEYSVTGEYSTLDLKDASDMVPYAVIRKLFPEHMWKYIDACRSEWTESPIGDRMIRLRKFAPMGSALCFPVMALYLWSGMRHYIARKRGIMPRSLAPIYVYGDDIVVPTKYFQDAIEAINALGLKVNTDKSFTNSKFLESCGADCFDGNLITPFRIRRLTGAKRDNPRVISKPESLLNLLGVAAGARKVFPRFSETLYQLVESVTGPLPYGVGNSPYLCRVVDDPETAWRTNATLDLDKKGKVAAWGIKKSEVSVNEPSYGSLRRSLSMVGTERKRGDFAPGSFMLGDLYLVKRKYQRWYDSAYA